jgi:selenoprotein W-related protein
VTEDILTNYQHIIDEYALIMGTKGAFEFRVDGELIYSKHRLGRHAEPGEVLRLFKELVGPDVATYPSTS